jgi:hypothetical protein
MSSFFVQTAGIRVRMDVSWIARWQAGLAGAYAARQGRSCVSAVFHLAIPDFLVDPL